MGTVTGTQRRTERSDWLMAVMLPLAALAPAGLAAAQVANVPDAARDRSVVRVLGLEAQVWRGLDTAVEVALGAAPVGTRAARAALGGALVVAAAGAVLYLVVVALLQACAETRRLGSVVAAMATLLSLVAGPWQSESSVVGGSATGALLVLLPTCLLVSGADDARRERRWRAAAFALALAFGYEPLVGACALAGAAALTAAGDTSRRSVVAEWRASAGSMGMAFAAGLAPWLLGMARVRSAGVPLLAAMGGGSWAGEPASLSGSPASMALSQVGPAALVLAAGGTALAMVVARARPLGLALLAIAACGIASGAAHAPCGPSRFSGPFLAALSALCALAGAGMQGVVRLVSNARVPFARASAAMVLLLEIVLPVDAADEALARVREASPATAAWEDAAWGELPPGAVLLLTTQPVWLRASAARARGALRDDIVVLPTFASHPLARRELASDAALLPLWRDLEIAGAPSEASLAAVAAARPLAMAYEPRWGRALGMHLVPEGLFDHFELEPRGASDRRATLAAFVPRRERLARLTGGDAELKAQAASLLRARALLLATVDPRDTDAIGKAVEDVRAFSPDDPIAAQVLARIALKGGSGARFDDLRP